MSHCKRTEKKNTLILINKYIATLWNLRVTGDNPIPTRPFYHKDATIMYKCITSKHHRGNMVACHVRNDMMCALHNLLLGFTIQMNLQNMSMNNYLTSIN